MKNLVLIGFMGSGKTSTGKELAKLLNFDFLDMDQSIQEKAGMTIPQIFDQEGEAAFRDREAREVEGLRTCDHLVIATGGGAWLNESNRGLLKALGPCVWLKVSADQAWKRVASHLAQRPLLARSADPFAEMKARLETRAALYGLADLSIETDGKSSREVALELHSMLRPPSGTSPF